MITKEGQNHVPNNDMKTYHCLVVNSYMDPLRICYDMTSYHIWISLSSWYKFLPMDDMMTYHSLALKIISDIKIILVPDNVMNTYHTLAQTIVWPHSLFSNNKTSYHRICCACFEPNYDMTFWIRSLCMIKSIN